jgi:hypothetical protein
LIFGAQAREFASKMQYNRESIKERNEAVERLREFLSLSYMTAAEAARRMEIREETVYSWLSGQSKPAKLERLTALLDSLPVESGAGIAPTGYEYREYKNWRGIPKPRRCPFCKSAKGAVRKIRGGYQGFCPNCGATGPKLESKTEALRIWNGRNQ